MLSQVWLIGKIVKRICLRQCSYLINAAIFWKIEIILTKNQESKICMIQLLCNFKSSLRNWRFKNSKRIILRRQMTQTICILKLRILIPKFLMKVRIKISILIIFNLKLSLTHKERSFQFPLSNLKEIS